MNHQPTGFRPYVHVPGCHFGYLFLTHSHLLQVAPSDGLVWESDGTGLDWLYALFPRNPSILPKDLCLLLHGPLLLQMCARLAGKRSGCTLDAAFTRETRLFDQKDSYALCCMALPSWDSQGSVPRADRSGGTRRRRAGS